MPVPITPRVLFKGASETLPGLNPECFGGSDQESILRFFKIFYLAFFPEIFLGLCTEDYKAEKNLKYFLNSSRIFSMSFLKEFLLRFQQFISG